MLEGILFYLKLLGKVFNLNHIFVNLSQLVLVRVNNF